MVIYLLKSTVCLVIFIAFYKAFLEQEQMHVFKRFYLLAIILISFTIPVIVFTEYIEMQEPITNNINYSSLLIIEESIPVISPSKEIDWSPFIWGIYGLGLLLFGYKFLKNLLIITKRIRKNQKIKTESNIKVLLEKSIVPHTFFQYIFLNKKKYLKGNIPTPVLLHEETHATQKHSVDVLIIELLQTIFWFNPVIYLLKHSIKLNHEFLADQAVIKEGTHPSDYQKTILRYSSIHQPPLANAINYSSIKKRFKVMKKETSKKGTFVRSSLLLPLLAILLFGFSETKTVVKEKDSALKPNRFYLEGSSNRTIEVAGLVLDSKTLFPLANVKLYNENGKIISTTDSKGYYQIKFNNLAEGEVFFQFTLNKIGYKPFQQKEHWGNLNGKIKSSIVIGLQKKESSSPEFSELFTNTQDLSYESIQEKLFLIEKQHKFNQKLEDAKNGNQNIYFEIDYTSYLVSNSGWIKINSKNDLISIDDNRNILAFQLNGILERKQITGMTPLEGYEDAFFGVYTTTKNINTKRKSENLDFKLKSYNSLAKKYNAIPIEKRIISIKDLRVLETIYREMTEEQKRNAQPFPECLPKNKQNGASREQIAEYNKLAKHYNEMSSDHMRIIKKDVERLKYIYGLMSEKQKTSAQPFPDLPEPPQVPEAPKVPLVYNSSVESTLNYAAQPGSPNSPKNLNTINYSDKFKQIIAEQNPNDVIEPNSPPTPKSPLDYIIEMAKNGATFMHEGENISSDQAIDLLKNNKELNIESKTKNGIRIIRITKDPVTID